MKYVKSILLIMLCSMVALTACKNEESSQSEKDDDKAIVTNGREGTILIQNLQTPWSIQKHRDTFYISERTGYIYVYDGESGNRQSVQLQKQLAQTREAGLLGFYLKPNFEDSREAFAYYTYQEGDRLFNRLTVIKQVDNQWQEQTPLLDQIPADTFHHGGRIKIGPDQKLYVTVGDGLNPDAPQDINSINGKILRMDLDGSIPPDNPFQNSYVYSYGLRNPQGIAWDSQGFMYSTDHGQTALDEINRIQAGKNYGWPVISGNQQQSGMEPPLIHSGNTTWAPSGMDIADRTIYFAALRGEGVYRYNIDSNQVDKVVQGYGRIRDVWIDDATLYFVTNNTDGRGNPDLADDKLVAIPLPR
ncbi:PQQ-dependent sugar dehydrogenase [Bacillus litorisediminis]|uniref:PQQ-dependent sugar dehydrogenase n=1 Tax=Bacillus litorisediminis TaxID=2922713 RepID=UPI001FAEFC47|nr:PQQ-dependent sugar dehydrogenase [Bacillus litorisediminis]